MRLYLKISPNRGLIPYYYQQNLVGTFHKWLGENQIHDGLSLYSLSWLMGGKGTEKGLRFKSGALWFISSPNIELIKQVIAGIQNDPVIAFGMEVKEVMIKNTPTFPSEFRFNLASPVLIKRKIDNETVHYSFMDKNANELMTQTLKSKLRKAKMDAEEISISFDKTYPLAKQKVVEYNGISNKANMCPVIIKGSPEAIAFAWDVGIGNSTGIGFGALK